MYTVKMTRGLRCKILHTGLSMNNARVILMELKRLDKRAKFEYSIEQVKN